MLEYYEQDDVGFGGVRGRRHRLLPGVRRPRRTAAHAVARARGARDCTTRPSEVAELRANAGTHDVQTDRGRLRLVTSRHLPDSGRGVPGAGRRTAHRRGRDPGRVRQTAVVEDSGRSRARGRRRPLAGRPRPGAAVATGGCDSGASASGTCDARLSVRGADDELDQVAHAFNHALARVEQSVGEMRQFSAALAHELRTPRGHSPWRGRARAETVVIGRGASPGARRGRSTSSIG